MTEEDYQEIVFIKKQVKRVLISMGALFALGLLIYTYIKG